VWDTAVLPMRGTLGRKAFTRGSARGEEEVSMSAIDGWRGEREKCGEIEEEEKRRKETYEK
jgi:hypothetical protein